MYKIDYSFTAPGFNDSIGEFIVIEDDYSSSGTFHTTSVISVDKITLMQYIIGSIEKSVEVEAFPEYFDDLNLDDLNVMSFLMKDDSLQTSLIVGIEHAERAIEYESFLMVYLTFDFLTSDSLQFGDRIIEINGRTDYNDALDDIECLDVVEFKIIRNEEELTVHATKNQFDDGTCSIGIYLSYYSEIVDTDVDYELIDTNTGGPSGGLMQSLYIYNLLTEIDLAAGLRVAGTGTISVDGSVGYIGAIKQKIITASMNNIDVFFVPHLSDDENDNYIQALEVYNTLETDMILVGVSNFQDAVDYLLEYGSGDNNE